MQDIDFDEIDRAVSSVTNSGVPKRESVSRSVPERSSVRISIPPTPTPAPAFVPPVATPSVPVVSKPIKEEPVEVVTPVASTPAAPSSPAARRSTGRFMDVVHASSDMRPDRPSTPAAPEVQREEVAEREEPTITPEPTVAPSPAFHWPDPIDTLQPSTPAPFETPKPVEIPAPVVEEVVTEEASTPLESPFLSNAKIEKRPLGAFSDTAAELPLIEDPIPFSSEDAAQTDVAPELSKEVEALLAEPAETQIDLNDEVPLPDEIIAEEPESVEQPAIVSEPAPAPTPIEEIPVGPTSITQQYKEQPSTTSTESSGSIYDTEAYHQPLVHTPKKHSGILVVVWIVSLILVGGGIGAGVYFVLLPMLG